MTRIPHPADLNASPRLFGETVADGNHVDTEDAAAGADSSLLIDWEPDPEYNEPVILATLLTALVAWLLNDVIDHSLPGSLEEAITAAVAFYALRWARSKVKPL